MSGVTIYTKSWCPFCARAKQLLDKKGVSYVEIDIENDHKQRGEMVRLSGRLTVPQVFIGTHHVGGSEDLYAAEINGELDSLLAQSRRAS